MKYFTMIPNQMLEQSQLTIQARYLYCVLCKYCGQEDSCFPSQKTLAKCLNLSDRQVRNLLGELIKSGVVTKKRRGWNRSNTYKVEKSLVLDRKSGTPHIGNSFPLHQGDSFPTINTYIKGKGKRSSKGLERLRITANQIRNSEIIKSF